MEPSQHAAGLVPVPAQAGPDIDMEELQQRLSKLRNISGTLPLPSRDSDAACQSTPTQDSGRRPRPANLHQPADSGYGSIAPSPDTQKAEFVGQDLPGTNLKYFNQRIPEQLNERFHDVKFLYTKPLLDMIAQKRRNPGDVVMKLKYLGRTEQSAEPHIVIQCEKKTAKIVKKFFSQRYIAEELDPYFHVLVLDKELTRLADEDAIQVFANAVPYKTWCGTPITMINALGCSAAATLGGFVMVKDAAGKKVLYGLTASHALTKLRASSLPSPDATDSDSDLSETESEASEEACNISTLEMLGSYGDSEEEVTVHTSQLIGSVVYHTLDFPTPGNLDWALFDLADIKPLPNMIVLQDRSPSSPEPSKRQGNPRNEPNAQEDTNGTNLTWKEPDGPRGFTSRQVSVITRQGTQAGTLMFNSSSVLIAPGQKFVEIHELSMRPIMRLQPGDSGSWVVDETTGEVFGYVVSVDAFGEAQVMPFELVMADIRQNLDAASVWLPSPGEIDMFQDEARQQPSESRSSSPGLSPRNRDDTDDGPRRFSFNPQAAPWIPETPAMFPLRTSRRSRSVDSRSYPEPQYYPFQQPPAQQYGHRREPYFSQPFAPYPQPSSYRPPTRYSPAPLRDGEARAPHPHQFSVLHMSQVGPHGFAPQPQGYISVPPSYISSIDYGVSPSHISSVDYGVSRDKHGTDSGYASRTSSHQPSPVPSPPQPTVFK